MKWAWLLISLVAVASAMEHDDLRKLMLGYIEGLEVTEDIYDLLACVDDEQGAHWDKSIEDIKKAKWDDDAQALLALASFIDPAFNSLATLMPCSKGEIGKINGKLQYWAQHPEEFTKRALENLDIVGSGLSDVLAKWMKGEYVEAGNVAGALVQWVFVNQQ